MKQPKIDTAAIFSVLAGGLSAMNSLFTTFGGSLGYVSIREPGIDVLENHVVISGFFFLASCVALWLSSIRGWLAWYVVVVAVMFVVGFSVALW